MRRLFNGLLVLVTLSLTFAPPSLAGGASSPGRGCPSHAVCDRGLGLALIPPPGWVQLRPPQVPRHEIDFVRLEGGHGFGLRLVIRSLGTTRDRNDRRAASVAVKRLVPAHGSRVTQKLVRYASTPGVMLTGLPAAPGPATDIVLAHSGRLYVIILPGTRLGADQKAALKSLRFIPRSGSLPPGRVGSFRRLIADSSHRTILMVAPNPVRLGQPLHVTLTGFRPGTTIFFIAVPHIAGFGGGNMGSYRTGPSGALHFIYPAFRDSWDMTSWRITAVANRRQVASVLLRVVASRPAWARGNDLADF